MKRIFKKFVTFGLIFFAVNYCIGLFLEVPKNDLIENDQYYPKLRWNDFFEQSNNSIDLVFLGSSHCYRSFVPSVFDSILGVKSFNMGSASQTPTTSYYILKEILKTQSPEHIVLELSWLNWIDNDDILGMDNNQFSNAYYNLEYFRDLDNKVEFVLNEFGYREYVYLFLTSVRYRKNWVQSINSIFLDKPFVKKKEYYSDRGFVESNSVFESENINSTNALYLTAQFSKDKVLKKLHSNFMKMVELCKSKNIKLYLVTAPIAPKTYSLMTNYESIHEYYETLSSGLNLSYMDYNLINEQESFLFNEHFKDDNHLNSSGAKIFSDYYGKKLKENSNFTN